MITKWLLRVIATKQRANGLNPLVHSFPSLSVTSQTNEMIDTCHSHLVANGNSLQEKGGGSIPLALGIHPN